MIQKPECPITKGIQSGVFGSGIKCTIKLRRCGPHINWRCLTHKIWVNYGHWLPKYEVAEYLKQYSATIDDIPFLAKGE